MECIRDLHQYYHDCLSRPVDFPDIGELPPELIEWVTDPRNTDVTQLAEYLEDLPGSGLPPDEDRALRLMLYTILQANLASDANNRSPDFRLSRDIAAGIQRGLGRVLELHPAYGYIVICVQLLYRIKELEEVIALSETYPAIFAQYPVLQAIAGFIHTMIGDYEKGWEWLQPLLDNESTRMLPLVRLSAMTCEVFLGKFPEQPVSFESIEADTANLDTLLEAIAPLEMLQPLERTSRPVVFAACDKNYFFHHAVYLAYSLHQTNAGKLDLHLHLYSPDQQVFDEIERLRSRLPGLLIGVSAESGAVPFAHPPTYYATVRFVRAWQVLRAYQCELCMIDADAIFNAPWDTFAAQLPPRTELVLSCPDPTPFWEQVLGGFLYCKSTPLAERFLAKVSQFILTNMQKGRLIWFADQIALSAVDHYFNKDSDAVYRPNLRRLIDMQFGDDALCWAVTTKKTGNPKYDAARERLEARYA